MGTDRHFSRDASARERGWLMFLLGAWLAGTLLVGVVAAENFYTIDRLFAESGNVSFHAEIGRIGSPQSRELLRYLSSELNRLYFRVWHAAQLAMGVPMLWLAWRMPRKVRWGVAAMLGVVVLLAVWLTPQIISIGRTLDFVPREPEPPQLGRFWTLHGLYTTLDLASVVMGVIVAVWAARSSPEAPIACAAESTE
jgi:hypothetical protein